MSCLSPLESIGIYTMSKTTDGNDDPVLHFTDVNLTERVTGYNVYRSSNPAPAPSTWPRIGLDVTDMDGSTPNVQWTDTSGDPSPTEIWYYEVTAYNHHCSTVSDEGPF